ncbi:phage-like element PBSX protein XkdP [Heyndrickxia oleronia]|nr:phage-like element PBSX protein XkdP [Heyndrickxia oleronia]
MCTMYEFWLSYNNNAERLQLPVNPSELSIGNGSQNETHSISRLGEITILQDPTLKTFDFSSFFPLFYAPFCSYKNIPKPWEAVQTIERWKKSGKPIRFIVTKTPINYAVSIEDFPYRENEDVGTIYFDLSLKEYPFINVRTITQSKDGKKAEVSKKSQRQNPKPATPKTYKVKQGQSLWIIAQKQLGSGARFKEIAKLNGIKAPYIIHTNQTLKMPEKKG